MIKFFPKALLFLALIALTAVNSPLRAETLSFSNWLPPTHPVVVYMLKPWIEAVDKESNGKLKIKLLPKPLGKPPAHFDLAKDGIADITFGVHGYQPGRFILTKAAEMPFLGDDAVAISVAYWRIHNKYLKRVGEHRGIELLGLMTHTPGHIFNTKRPINRVADLGGLKMRVGGGVINDVSKALGVSSLLKPASKSYELLSNGVADGIMFPLESIASFRLTKLIRYATLIPGGLYNTSFFLAMNKAKFEKLGDEEKAALLRASGENFARIAGEGWKRGDEESLVKMRADGIDIRTASDSLIAEIKKSVLPVEEAWIKEAGKKGVDGAEILREFRAEIKKLENGD